MLVENLESRLLFSVGVLDHSFGPGGEISVSASDDVESIVVQKNGSFVVAGTSDVSGSSAGFLERYRANGKLDPTFGSRGRVDLNPAQFANVLSLALSPDGKIVAIGTDGNGNDFLGRFDSSGKVDATFGSAGTVELPPNTVLPQAKVESDKSIAIAADDNLSGSAFVPGNFSGVVGELFHFTRFGTADTHFGNNGIVTTDLGEGYAVGDFELPRAGKIEAFFYNLSTPGAAVTDLQRFNANGAIDPTFVQNVGQSIPATNANRFLPDGSILSLGSAFTGTLTATHYNAEGVLDPRFGAQGPAMLAFPPNNGNSTNRAVVEPGFKLLLIEEGENGTTPYIAFGGLTTNGRIDKPFGKTGVVPITPAGTIVAVAGDGSRVILLETIGGTEEILAYKI